MIPLPRLALEATPGPKDTKSHSRMALARHGSCGSVWDEDFGGLEQSTSFGPTLTVDQAGVRPAGFGTRTAQTSSSVSISDDPSWLMGTGSLLSDIEQDPWSNRVKPKIDLLGDLDLRTFRGEYSSLFESYQEHIPCGNDAHHSMHGPATLPQSYADSLSRTATSKSSNSYNDVFSIPSDGYDGSDCSSMSIVGSPEHCESYYEPLASKDDRELAISTLQNDKVSPHPETEPQSIETSKAIVSKLPLSGDRTTRTPLRLLCVKASFHGTELHLLEIHQGRPPLYLSFSHGWAQDAHIASTTKENLRTHDRHVPLASLPKMYQDAVAITRSFGLSYLWIDDFCEYENTKDRSTNICELGTIFCEAFAMIICDASGLTVAEGLPGIRIIEIRTHVHEERTETNTIWQRWLNNPTKPWTFLSNRSISANPEIRWTTYDSGFSMVNYFEARLGISCAQTHLRARHGGKLFGTRVATPLVAGISALVLGYGQKAVPGISNGLKACKSYQSLVDTVSSSGFLDTVPSPHIVNIGQPDGTQATPTPVLVSPGVETGTSIAYGAFNDSDNWRESGSSFDSGNPLSSQEASPQLNFTNPSAEVAVDVAAGDTSEHNGCKLRCPRCFAETRGPHCTLEVCTKHNHATVGHMKELHLRKHHKYPPADLKIPKEKEATERRKWNLLYLRVVHGWVYKDPNSREPTIGQTYEEWVNSNPNFREFPVPYILNMNGNCAGCDQPCYPEPVSCSENTASQRLTRLAQGAFNQSLLHPKLRIPEQPPTHRRRRAQSATSRRSEDERSLDGELSNKRRRMCRDFQGSNEAEAASDGVLEETEAPELLAVPRQSKEDDVESRTLSSKRSISSPSMSFVKTSTNATSRMSDVGPPSSPLPIGTFVEKLCPCPDYEKVGDDHFYCHGSDFCNCCSKYKAWSEKGAELLGPLPTEICQCKDWPGADHKHEHVRCHGKDLCFCCKRWKAYSARGQRFLVYHGLG